MAKRKKKQGFTKKIREIWEDIVIFSKSIPAGIIILIVALFLSFAFFNLAGPIGEAVTNLLFTVFFGWSYFIFITMLFASGYIIVRQIEIESPIRIWLSSILLILSSSLFFTISFGENDGGLLGKIVFSLLKSTIGEFTYLISPVLLLTSIALLFPLIIEYTWEWITNKNENEDEEDDEEYEDEDDYEDDEEEEEYEDEDEEDDDEDYEDEDDEDEEEDEIEEGEEEDDDEEEEIEEKSTQPKVQAERKPYVTPPFSLLQGAKSVGRAGNTKQHKQIIERTMSTFNIDVNIEDVTVGPTFTRYSLRPAEGVKLNKITGLQQNLELALASHPIRIEAPIPGQSLVGIEVPNTSRAIVGLRSLIDSNEFKGQKNALPLAIGKNISGDSFVTPLSKMPHLLVAGTTGSGKSVLIHNLILSMIFRYGPEKLRFIFIDPKRVELTLYKGISHMFTDPITNPKEALKALTWVVSEMERRYELLEEAGARDIISYNKQTKEKIPYLAVVIDELADLMQNYPREIESNIVRIAQKSRAVGIHLIVSTQRPSVNIITGVVKANIPVRIALQVASNIDSRTILDTPGAENLTGNGDLLYVGPETKKPLRVQSAFVDEDEVKNVVKFLIQKNGMADGLIDINEKQKSNVVLEDDDDEDDLYAEAKQIVIESKKASTSLLQRKLKIGYSRAARLIDTLEDRGVVGPQDGSKPREVLVEES